MNRSQSTSENIKTEADIKENIKTEYEIIESEEASIPNTNVPEEVETNVKTEYERELEKYAQESLENKCTSTNNKNQEKFTPKSDAILLKIYPDYHSLSTEEQIFFIKITEGIFGYNEQIRTEMLKLLSVDYNITFLVPYICVFIKESIHLNIVYSDLTLLIYAVRMTKSLLANQYVNLKKYLHDLLPAIISCALAKKISKYYYDNHWTLRDFSAYVVAMICHMYSNKYNHITQRVINIYLSAIKDPKKPLTTVYGALKGLGSLGEEVVKNILFPNITNLSNRLFSILEKKSFYMEDKQQLIDAKHVRDVVLNIVCPLLLKTRNINDGGLTYVRDFGYLGRDLYIQVKNLEKIELDRKQFMAIKYGNPSNLTMNPNYVGNYLTQQEFERNKQYGMFTLYKDPQLFKHERI